MDSPNPDVTAALDNVFRYVDLRALVAGYKSACAHGDWAFAHELSWRIERDGPPGDAISMTNSAVGLPAEA